MLLTMANPVPGPDPQIIEGLVGVGVLTPSGGFRGPYYGPRYPYPYYGAGFYPRYPRYPRYYY